MTLVPTRDLTRVAARAGTGIGACNVIHLVTAETRGYGRERRGDSPGDRLCARCKPLRCGGARQSGARMTKIIVSTHLDGFFTAGIRNHLAQHPTVVDSRKCLAAGRNALDTDSARLLTLFELAPKTGAS
jgi:hypothetical protein